MASLTFTMNDLSTGTPNPQPTVTVTITENSDGTVTFVVAQSGPNVGDISGFWFDIADESILSSLTFTPLQSPTGTFTPTISVTTGNDSVTDLGTGVDLSGESGQLYGTDGGYDVGVKITSAPPDQFGEDDYRTVSFKVDASRDLTVNDFNGMDFGVRIRSVGFDFDLDGDGDGGGSWKIYEGHDAVPQTGTIIGTKYHDKNADGEYDSGENGLAGWTIQLLKLGAVVATTLTDASGNYSFANLQPGEYTIREVQQDGWSTISGTERTVTVLAGQTTGTTEPSNSSTDFLNYELGCIEGEKYYDKDADGCLDEGEATIAGWKVYLYEIKDGVKSAEPVACTYTDECGKYKFSGLEPGCYVVVEDQPEGWSTKAPTSYEVKVEVGETYGDDSGEATDFLNYEYACIEGEKYDDTDRSGGQTSYDRPLEGWKIYLYEAKDGEKCGEPIACTTTNSYGAYKFGKLDPGCYVIVEEQPKGWDSAAPTERLIKVEAGQRYGDDCEEETDFFNYKLNACIDVEKYVSVDGGKTWWDVDCPTGPVADQCDKIQYKFVVKNTGELDLCNVSVTDNKIDLNGSASGTAWQVGKLAVGECETLIICDTWKYGQQSNVATATGEAKYGWPSYNAAESTLQSYEEGYTKTVSDSDAAYTYGIKGVHDASYWKSKIGQLAWDGKANPNKYCLPKYDLLQDTNGDKKLDGLRIGDLNFNGKQDKGECTIVYSKATALAKLCATGSGAAQIEKQLVAAWLNFKNGNNYSDGDGELESCEPAYWINQALKYLKACGSKSSNKVAAWSKGVDIDKDGVYGESCDVQSGAKILAVLTQYNKDGTIACKDHSAPEKVCGCGSDDDVIAQTFLANALT